MATNWPRVEAHDADAQSTDDGAVFWLRTFVLVSGFLFAAVGIVHFARARPDYQALFDEQLEVQWLDGRDLVPADDFFAQGGVFETNGASRESIDQKYVVPLIRRLEEQHGVEFQVLLEENDRARACALVAEAPQDREKRNAVRAAVLETADKFPGLVYQNWGHRWLTLDFFDELEITPLKQTGALARLQASQRRME